MAEPTNLPSYQDLLNYGGFNDLWCKVSNVELKYIIVRVII